SACCTWPAASVLATAGTVTSVAAQPRYDSSYVPPAYDRTEERALSINERESRLNARIERGHSDGRLTERETHRLRRELSNIEGKERAYLADGRLNRRETDELNRDLDHL